jgi:hypothetical protein
MRCSEHVVCIKKIKNADNLLINSESYIYIYIYHYMDKGIYERIILK